jgi:PAS domain S-box-containing protein
MRDIDKTREQLIDELVEMRQRIVELEALDAKRKRVEGVLQESEKKYRTLVENSPNLVAVYQDGHFKYVNGAMCNRLGWTYEELTSPSFDPVEVLVSEGSRHIVRERIAKRLRGEYVSPYETNLKTRDGSAFPVLVHGAAISYGGKPANQIIFVDVTERKQAEEVLRLTQERLQRMFESVTDGILVIDLNGVITEANQRVLEMHGYKSKDELLGRSAFELVAPRDHERMANNMRKALEQGTIRGKEYTLLRADGTEFPGELSTSALKDASGNWVGHITLASDITQRKRAEEKLRKLHEQEKEERIKLEREREKRLQFTNVLAHELKTPLTSVIASGGLLLEELKNTGQSSLLRLTENILSATKKLEARLSELLDMARMESLGFELKLELLDMRPLLQNIVNELLPAAAEKHQILTLYMLPSVPMVNADKERVEQVLLNLLTNAIKFSRDGSKIQLGLRRAGNEVVVEVKDNGPGIPKEDQARLFIPYYRGEADRQRSPGSGLGLAVSKQLVELHGGRMWVESELGKGSTLSFSLAVAKQEEESATNQ